MALNSTAEAPTPAHAGPAPRRVSLGLVVVVVLIVAGASVAGTTLYFTLKPAPSASGVTVTDDLGRTVVVPYDPSRVAILGPNIMDAMFLLNLTSHVTGIDCSNSTGGGVEGDYTPSQIVNWSLLRYPCITAYPALSTADLLAVNPQVVLASSVISTADLESFSTTYNIPVVIFDPSTLGGVIYDVQMLSAIFGAPAGASTLIAHLQLVLSQSEEFLTNLTDNGTPLQSVFMTYYPVPAGSPDAGYYSFGPGSFGQSLIEQAGGTNIAGNVATSDPELSGSFVLAANPGVVIYGVGFGIDAAAYQAGPNWNQIPAVAAGNVTGVDVTLMTEVDPTMVFALPMFEHILYPTLAPA